MTAGVLFMGIYPNDRYDSRMYYVYVLINEGNIVYVGRTGDIKSRIMSHIREKKKIFDSWRVVFEDKRENTVAGFEKGFSYCLILDEERAVYNRAIRSNGISPIFTIEETIQKTIVRKRNYTNG